MQLRWVVLHQQILSLSKKRKKKYHLHDHKHLNDCFNSNIPGIIYIIGISLALSLLLAPRFLIRFLLIVLNLKLQTWFLRYTVTDQLNFVNNISRQKIEMANISPFRFRALVLITLAITLLLAKAVLPIRISLFAYYCIQKSNLWRR